MRAAIHIVIMMMTNSLIVSFVCSIKVPTRVMGVSYGPLFLSEKKKACFFRT